MDTLDKLSGGGGIYDEIGIYTRQYLRGLMPAAATTNQNTINTLKSSRDQLGAQIALTESMLRSRQTEMKHLENALVMQRREMARMDTMLETHNVQAKEIAEVASKFGFALPAVGAEVGGGVGPAKVVTNGRGTEEGGAARAVPKGTGGRRGRVANGGQGLEYQAKTLMELGLEMCIDIIRESKPAEPPGGGGVVGSSGGGGDITKQDVVDLT